MAKVLISSLNAGNPLFLQPSDHSNVPIVCFKLTGCENYKMWSTVMKIPLKGKNKMGFVDGTCVRPVTNPLLSQQWERCNVVVLGWILCSLSQELYIGQVYSEIAFEVWSELQETYDKMDGENLIFLLPACTCTAHKGVLKHNQLVRLMQFLMGLNDVYPHVRSNLLAREPLPEVKDAFVIVSREESHRGLAPGKLSIKSSHAAFFVRTNINNNNNSNKRVNTNNNNNRGPNLNLVCKHCGLIGHTIDRCYELNGYPAGFKRFPNLSRQSGFVKKFNGNAVVS
ncbi:putative transcription factor interactor and regulator CCHC(Zn) family protein [Tanacetum coccineum]|uniref:Transcription factor interactor and regulator CCHC(Zn) family protein n=1 Tax=Tanacetum coccineum TaxID=301880 RepID=A0ABQ5FXW9_9ASTR